MDPQVYTKIIQGVKPAAPKSYAFLDQRIGSLLARCWDSKPHARPTIQECLAEVNALCVPLQPSHPGSSPPSPVSKESPAYWKRSKAHVLLYSLDRFHPNPRGCFPFREILVSQLPPTMHSPLVTALPRERIPRVHGPFHLPPPPHHQLSGLHCAAHGMR